MLDSTGPSYAYCPEDELLLCCTRTQMDAERAERIKVLLQENLDWKVLLELASQHGVLPCLYWHLKPYADVIPRDFLEELRNNFHAIARHNLLYAEELLRLVKLFDAHHIPVVPFKGPSLAASVYGNLALRQFGDLDILVHKHHILRARDLLITQGYEPTIQLNSIQEEAYLQTNYHTFVRNDGRVGIDLQWRLKTKSFSFTLDTEDIWERFVPFSWAGTLVYTFPPEDLLLVLCIHGTKHLWARLKWICDVAELLRVHAGMDWSRVMAQARRTHSERMLLLGLYLAKALLGAAFPEDVWHRAQGDSAVRSVAARVSQQLFAEVKAPPGDFARFVLYLRIKDGLQGRANYCLTYLRRYLGIIVIPTAKERTFLPLPVFLSPVYYLLRPIRLAGKYCLKPWKWKDLLPHRLDVE